MRDKPVNNPPPVEGTQQNPPTTFTAQNVQIVPLNSQAAFEALANHHANGHQMIPVSFNQQTNTFTTLPQNGPPPPPQQ